jgi:hypothetical protein
MIMTANEKILTGIEPAEGEIFTPEMLEELSNGKGDDEDE